MTSLLPYNLRDDSFLALEKCAKSSLEVDIKTIMTSIVDYVPDSVLPSLAEMFSVSDDGYNTCSTRDEKIKFIKNAVSLHRRKGTIGAVEDLIELYGILCTVTEWTEYGGIPHHFKIDLTADETGVDIYEMIKEIISRLNQYKQLRAKLDELNFASQLTKTYYTASAVVMGETITI